MHRSTTAPIIRRALFAGFSRSPPPRMHVRRSHPSPPRGRNPPRRGAFRLRCCAAPAACAVLFVLFVVVLGIVLGIVGAGALPPLPRPRRRPTLVLRRSHRRVREAQAVSQVSPHRVLRRCLPGIMQGLQCCRLLPPTALLPLCTCSRHPLRHCEVEWSRHHVRVVLRASLGVHGSTDSSRLMTTKDVAR